MVWLVLSAVIFIVLVLGIYSSYWSVERAHKRRLRGLPPRKRKRARSPGHAWDAGPGAAGGWWLMGGGGSGDSGGDGGGSD